MVIYLQTIDRNIGRKDALGKHRPHRGLTVAPSVDSVTHALHEIGQRTQAEILHAQRKRILLSARSHTL